MHPELTLSRAIRQTHSKASRADVTITECRTIPLDNSPGQFPLPFWVGHFPQTIPPIYYAYIHIRVSLNNESWRSSSATLTTGSIHGKNKLCKRFLHLVNV